MFDCWTDKKWSVPSRHTASPENDDLHYGCTYNYEMNKGFSLFKFREKNSILNQSIENQI